MKKLVAMINFIYFIFVFPLANLIPYSIFVRNALAEIDICEGRIELDLVKVWGADDVNNKNEIFRIPTEIKIYKEFVYIVDSGNNRIQVFDQNGKFIKTIGRKGKGPGDLLYPRSLIIDNQNNLIIADYSNSRIQVLDSSGNYLFSFPTKLGMPSYINLINQDEIAVYSFVRSFKTKFLLTLYNRKGQIIKEIGKHLDYSSSINNYESVSVCSDNSSNIYFAYCATPFIQKIDKRGKDRLSVVFESPLKTPLVSVEKSSKNLIIKGNKTDIISSAISADDEGNIYLVTTTRSQNKNEGVLLVGNNSGISGVTKSSEISDNTDRFRLLVFNKMGKIIAAKKLNIYCDSIYVFKDHVFIIDSFRGMKIYEYRFSFK